MPTAMPTPPTDRGCAAVGTYEDPRRRMGSGAGGKGPASPRASAFATPAPHQGCAAPAAGLRPPLTRRRRRQDHRLPTQNGGTHDLTTADKRTLATYATPAPARRSRSTKRTVTMPKSPVTLRRDARSRWTEMSGHVRRNTHQSNNFASSDEFIVVGTAVTLSRRSYPVPIDVCAFPVHLVAHFLSCTLVQQSI